MTTPKKRKQPSTGCPKSKNLKKRTLTSYKPRQNGKFISSDRKMLDSNIKVGNTIFCDPEAYVFNDIQHYCQRCIQIGTKTCEKCHPDLELQYFISCYKKLNKI
jgi:hypothetical protein